MNKWLGDFLAALIEPTESVLDLGVSPNSPAQNLPNRRIGVDVYQPYLDRAQNLSGKILHDLRRPLPFADRSFDVVLLLDVLEHLAGSAAINLLIEAERVTKRAVIVYTPLGFVEQTQDVYGLGGEFWMRHRSGFYTEYFRRRGYDVVLTRSDNKHRMILAVLEV